MAYDIIIIGSGPAALSAARELRGRKTLMLDIGLRGSKPQLENKPLYSIRQESENLQNFLVGNHFEALKGINTPGTSPKLRAETLGFVTKMPAEDLNILSDTFFAVQSFAKGGLSNAWGAGVLRFNDEELTGFEMSSQDLNPFYDDLTQHLGVNGAAQDDLTPFLGSSDFLLPPIPLSKISARLYQRYQKQNKDRLGIRVGRSRNAILTRDHLGRSQHYAYGQEFFQGNLQGIYQSGYSVEDLELREEFEYQASAQVLSFSENESGIEVEWKDLRDGQIKRSAGKFLFLAAGAINSAKIVLQSNRDTTTRLPLLDNAITFVPLFFPGLFGTQLDTRSFSGGELAIVVRDQKLNEDVYCSSYGLASPLRTDLLAELPLNFSSNLILLRELISNMMIVQVFYPDDPTHENYLKLEENGKLQIQYRRQLRGSAENQVLRSFRKLGGWGLGPLCKKMAPGSSIHYAGTLPMQSHSSTKYSCDPTGKLRGTKRVFCVDGANFPRLPSKNLTFTIMARAAKIAADFVKGGD